MNCRIRFIRLFGLLSAVLGLVVIAWAATAVITVFELDGNSVDDGGNAIADWNTLNGTTGHNGTSGGSNIRSFLNDPDGTTIFFGGGSKDNADIPNWKNKSGAVPDKDEIENAYAASYSAANGDTIVVFGADREAVSGDANIGIWFFQQTVGPNGSGGFTGQHVNHDVFIVSAFTGGGSTPGIKVYEWDNTCLGADSNNPQVGDCADTNIRVLFSSTQTCSSSGSGHEACAKVNTSNIVVSWPYTAKTPIGTNTVPAAGFFEGGINLTELFTEINGTAPCFASFLVETRSSQSIDAVLKDFVGGSFPQCHISLTKACACTAFHANGSGFDYSFNGTVANDGGGTVFNTTVTDQGKTYSCGQLNPGQSKNFPSVDCPGPAATFSNASFPTTNSAHAVADTSASGGVQVTADAQANCNGESPAGACTPNPQLTVDKTCVTTLEAKGGYVVVRVDYTGAVHNGGNVNINNVAVTEDDDGNGQVDATYQVGTLPKAGDAGADKCYVNNSATPCPTLTPPAAGTPPAGGAVGSYNPNTFSAVNVTPNGRALFKDTVRATGTTAFGVPVQSHPAGSGFTAECVICPFGFCSLQ